MRRVAGFMRGSLASSIIVNCLLGALIFLLTSVIMLISENLRSYDKGIVGKITLEIFLRDDTSPAELQSLQSNIKALPGIQSVENHDKAEAYAEMQRSLGNQILPDSGYNPFSSSIILSFSEASARMNTFLEMESNLEEIRCVEQVTIPKSLLAQHEQMIGPIAALSKVVMATSILTAIIFLFWAVRRAAVTRLPETRALRMLGGGFRHIQLPSLSFGVAVGTISAVIGGILLYLLWHSALLVSLNLKFVSSSGLVSLLLIGSVSGAIFGLLANSFTDR